MSATRFEARQFTLGPNAGKWTVGVYPPIGYTSDSIVLRLATPFEQNAQTIAKRLNESWTDPRTQAAGQIVAKIYPSLAIRHESATQPGLFYWAEANGGGAGAVESYCVVAQAAGAEQSEAADDWFAHWKDADEIAQQLARGEDAG